MCNIQIFALIFNIVLVCHFLIISNSSLTLKSLILCQQIGLSGTKLDIAHFILLGLIFKMTIFRGIIYFEMLTKFSFILNIVIFVGKNITQNQSSFLSVKLWKEKYMHLWVSTYLLVVNFTGFQMVLVIIKYYERQISNIEIYVRVSISMCNMTCLLKMINLNFILIVTKVGDLYLDVHISIDRIRS